MLDGRELAKRLKAAMAESGLSGSDLARICRVTPQAVSGWRSNGRIAKSHLQTIAEATGKPLEYFLGNGKHPTNGVRESPMHIKGERIYDVSNFDVVFRAWQDTDDTGRSSLLALARVLRGKSHGSGKRRGGGSR